MKVSGLPSALLGLVAALAGPAVVRADDTKDLGTILSGNKDLSTYYTLIQVCIRADSTVATGPLSRQSRRWA
jgi:hypothetical protein